MSAAEVYRKASPSVVVLMSMVGRDQVSQGSGVAVDPKTIITNWHVVEKAVLILVKTPPADEVGVAILIAQDADRDLAALRLLDLRVERDGLLAGGPKLVPAKISKRVVQVGEKMFAIGSPKGLDLTLSDGLVSQLRDEPKRKLIQTNVAISHGSSGGGLFNERAELVGFTTQSLEDGQALNFAVPVSYAEGLRAREYSTEAVQRLCELPTSVRESLLTRLDQRERAALASALGLSCKGGNDLDSRSSATSQPEQTNLAVGSSRVEMLNTWRDFANHRGRMELAPDYMLGFLGSRELWDCQCPRIHPAGVVARLESDEGIPELEADNDRAMKCERCVQRAFVGWKGRIDRQCPLLRDLSPEELVLFQRSADRNGMPPRCYPVAKSSPGTPKAERSLDSVGAVAVEVREAGRLYVRIDMHANCTAEVLPGPMTAHAGDLLLVPYGAKQISIRSKCGALVQVFWGKEETPRVRQDIAEYEPLHLKFKPE